MLFSCEFGEIFNTNYYVERSQAAASVFWYKDFVRIKVANSCNGLSVVCLKLTNSYQLF